MQRYAYPTIKKTSANWALSNQAARWINFTLEANDAVSPSTPSSTSWGLGHSKMISGKNVTWLIENQGSKSSGWWSQHPSEKYESQLGG